MTENKKKLRQQHPDLSGRQVSELFGTSCLALTSFGAHNTGYTAHFVRPNRLTPTSYSPKTLCFIKINDNGNRKNI
ncbi:MAG TPA: hypothetical protein PLU67_04030 [Candidatus Kapabacteria bacterium]|nr:hypothetical protein [Candidatus Kapabacteria bacterium]HPP39346.1 hypothetical protein [Candidatus Kapabacteria bacterium]